MESKKTKFYQIMVIGLAIGSLIAVLAFFITTNLLSFLVLVFGFQALIQLLLILTKDRIKKKDNDEISTSVNALESLSTFFDLLMAFTIGMALHPFVKSLLFTQ